MKTERKTLVRRTLEEREQVAKDKLETIRSTKLFRELKAVLNDKNTSIPGRVKKVRDMLTPIVKVETPKEEKPQVTP